MIPSILSEIILAYGQGSARGKHNLSQPLQHKFRYLNLI